MVYLGLEPRAAGWKTHTNPLSYGGTLCANKTYPLSVGPIYLFIPSKVPFSLVLTFGSGGQCDQIGQFFGLWATF